VIERYTIKFGPAVSQKEIEKALHESGDTPVQSQLHKMKARLVPQVRVPLLDANLGSLPYRPGRA
jgi:hypothetical protein